MSKIRVDTLATQDDSFSIQVADLNSFTSGYASFSENYIRLRDPRFGVVGDGVVDDSVAVQAAIDYAVANDKTLYVDGGTYLLGGARKGPYNAIVYLRSNLKMVGSGYNAHFKVPDNYTTGGDYRIFAPADTTPFTNVEISFIRIDGNGSNNLVNGSSGGDLRRGYAINMLSGSNIKIHNNWFENIAGRNCLNLGNNSATPDFSDVTIAFNRFRNVGGAIVGNGLQNDHSSIYLQTNRGLVFGNLFTNDVQPNPFTSPTKAVVALEIHGTHTIVESNIVWRYTGGGNLVAQISNSEDNSWINNRFFEMTSNVLATWSTAPFTNKRLTIRGNHIHIDNTTYTGGTAFFQNSASSVTGTELEDFVFEDNVVYATKTTQEAVTWYGMQIVALNGASIRRNTFRNIQGNAISIEPAISTLRVTNVDIEDNHFIDCGIHSPLSRIWAFYISNPAAPYEFSHINFRRNTIKRTPQAVGVTPYGSRGIRVIGGGYLNNIEIADNKFINIQRGQRYEFVTTTNNYNVYVKPSVSSNTSSADPVAGFFEIGREVVMHSDYAAGTAVGKVPTTSGAAVSGLWGATTAYVAGQWIRTSGNKVLKCITAGTSGASEPNPTVLGIQLSDGTATWMYMDTVLAVFRSYGQIDLGASVTYDPPSLADGAGVTTTVTVTGATLGDIATASFSNDLAGVTVTSYVSAANTVSVRFQNESGALVDLASGTLKVKVAKG